MPLILQVGHYIGHMASPIDMAAVEDVQEVVVVGGGVEGSATAYHLAKTGHRTLLLEQVYIIILIGLCFQII